MRIAVLAPLRFPIAEPFHGGLEMHTHLLVKALNDAGHDVTLFAHPGSDRLVHLEPVFLPENAGFIQQAVAYREAMRLITSGSYEAVHNNSIHFLPPLLTGGLKGQMITTLHTPPYRSLRWAGRYSRANNHTFVSISRHLQEKWRPFLGQHPVIHNGINIDQWPFSDEAAPKTAVWYGRFTPEKGAEYAIAAARIAGYRLTLAGPVYDQEYFADKIKPLLSDDVVYAGHLNREELARLIGNSSVGLVTSVWDEPFGLVYLEIPACGTPVAAFDSGAAAEIISPETGTIVPKFDTNALAGVLDNLATGDRRQRRQAITEHFSVLRMMNAYVALYRKIG